jgi:hypothetical protein
LRKRDRGYSCTTDVFHLDHPIITFCFTVAVASVPMLPLWLRQLGGVQDARPKRVLDGKDGYVSLKSINGSTPLFCAVVCRSTVLQK